MRRLAVVEFLTLDGVMQGFGGPDEDRESGFEHGGWRSRVRDDEIGRPSGLGIGATDRVPVRPQDLRALRGALADPDPDNPIARHRMNSTPTIRRHRTLASLDRGRIPSLDGDIVDP